MTRKHQAQNIYWSSIKNGKTYYNKIEHELKSWWPHIFGQFALKIGPFSHELSTKESHITNVFSLGDKTSAYSNIYAQSHELPIYSKSIDLCIASNLLEFSSYPQQIMHEIDRVLVDDGWLILTHINSFSLLGMQLLIEKIKKIDKTFINDQSNNNQLSDVYHLYSARKINDWLQLLNYEIVHTVNLNTQFDKDLHLAKPKGSFGMAKMLGGIRLVIARKRTIPLTHISNKKQSTFKNTQLIPNPLSESIEKTNDAPR